jgi:hypothetical protein
MMGLEFSVLQLLLSPAVMTAGFFLRERQEKCITHTGGQPVVWDSPKTGIPTKKPPLHFRILTWNFIVYHITSG